MPASPVPTPSAVQMTGYVGSVYPQDPPLETPRSAKKSVKIREPIPEHRAKCDLIAGEAPGIGPGSPNCRRPCLKGAMPLAGSETNLNRELDRSCCASSVRCGRVRLWTRSAEMCRRRHDGRRRPRPMKAASTDVMRSPGSVERALQAFPGDGEGMLASYPHPQARQSAARRDRDAASLLIGRPDGKLRCSSLGHNWPTPAPPEFMHQLRKGTSIPYLSHLMSVSALVLEHGGDEELAIAGLLHDAIEDVGAEQEAVILERYGARVAHIVRSCGDADTLPKLPWRTRKEAYLAHLEEADSDALLVSRADKLHDARAILSDLCNHGLAVFTRFKAVQEGTLRYYRALAEAFRRRLPSIALRFQEVVAAIMFEAGTSA
jgi:hypothetical protein